MTEIQTPEALPTFDALPDGWRTGVAYYRISDDPEHDEMGVNRQRHLVRAMAQREKIQLVAEYLDDDRSAFVAKKRPDYERYLEHAGHVDVALAWHPDRMTRGDLVEIERLIVALGGDNGTPIKTCETADYDVSTPHGRMIARITGSVARYESEHKSRRITEKMAELARDGKSKGGRRAYGYVGNTIVAHEAEIIREMVRRVLGGASIRELAAELNERGVPTSGGKAWHPNALKAVLVGWHIVGVRTYKGEVITTTRPDGLAEWPAIITADEHAAVVAMLNTRTPVGRRGRTPWLLTGLLRCEICDAPMKSNTTTGGRRKYTCRKSPGGRGCGRLSIAAEPVEARLGELVELRLADLEGRSADVADGSSDRAELTRIAADRITVTQSGLSLAARMAEHAELDRQQSAVEARLAAAVRQTSPLAFIVAEGYQGRTWASLEQHERRIVLGALIDHVTVGKAASTSPVFDASRIEAPGRIDWKA